MPNRPRIVIDATSASSRPTGAGRFVQGLASALPRVDRNHSYVALVTAEGAEAFGSSAELELLTVPRTSGSSWEVSGASAAARAAGAALLVTTREVLRSADPPVHVHVFEPPAYRLRVWRHRLLTPRPLVKDALLSAAFRASARRAGALTAGSQATADWIRDHLGIEAQVILPPLGDDFFAAGAVAFGEKPERSFLHLATGDARESTSLVLRALALLPGGAPTLVIAGARGERGLTIEREARRLGVSSRVRVLGWVSDEELRQAYRTALGLLHLTRYEGYAGYPALEAMALGTPVVGLRAPGATEALEGAALVIDREDPLAVAEAMTRLADDDGTLRATLAAAGRARVAPLRWPAAAAAFAESFAATLERLRR